ncbi:MAG: hypothetical protein ACYC97_05620 [Metallibacterium sp.]
MTIEELSALLPGNITLKPVGTDEDELIYHFWFEKIDFGEINIDSQDDITSINVKKQYEGQIENNQQVNNVLKANNLTINYV